MTFALAWLTAACATAVLFGCAPPAHHVPIGTVQTAAHLVPPAPPADIRAHLAEKMEERLANQARVRRMDYNSCRDLLNNVPVAPSWSYPVELWRAGPNYPFLTPQERWCAEHGMDPPTWTRPGAPPAGWRGVIPARPPTN